MADQFPASTEGSGIASTHPNYDEFIIDWMTMRDLYRGERVIKSKGELYLPATAGMHIDGMKTKEQAGSKAYEAYKTRALFHDYVKEGVEALIGMMHQKPPTFELPDQMKSLIDKATLGGESLSALLRRINVEQLLTGRIGLLADLPSITTTATTGQMINNSIGLPYIASYIAESIINWDEARNQEGYNGLNLVVLDESGFERNSSFTWRTLRKYRVLQLGDILVEDEPGTADYRAGVFTNSAGASNIQYSQEAMITPTLRGVSLKSIPFVFINTKDIISIPDDPPLLGLGKLTLAIYRGDADYRQNLFMQGQDTLVITGGVKKSDGTNEDDALRTGAGSMIEIDMGGDAKYIGVEGKGLTEQRESLDNDKKDAASKAGRLVEAGKNDAASGEALKTRITAMTATLNQMALAGALGLENLLKSIGTWMGLAQASVDGIKVIPNLEFADFALGAADIVQLMTARSLGAPLSRESIHAILVDRGMTQMSYEDEMDLIEEENAQLPPSAGTAGGPPLRPDPNAGANKNQKP